MSPDDSLPPPPPPPQGEKRGSGRPGRGDFTWPRWSLWVLLGLVAASLLFSGVLSSSEDNQIPYNKFIDRVEAGQVESVDINNSNARITGKMQNGDEFTTTGPLEGGIPDSDLELMRSEGVAVEFKTPESNFLAQLLPLLLPVALLIGFFWWMSRRQASQMGGIMSIGRSKAKTYSTERPGTTFADVAGY